MFQPLYDLYSGPVIDRAIEMYRVQVSALGCSDTWASLTHEGRCEWCEKAKAELAAGATPPVHNGLPTDAAARKAVPVATGFVDYFPLAIAAVAELSRIGNDQHNPGKPLCWDRSKSGDESDALMRHFLERGTIDTDGVRHSAKVAWRAMALLQKELEDAART